MLLDMSLTLRNMPFYTARCCSIVARSMAEIYRTQPRNSTSAPLGFVGIDETRPESRCSEDMSDLEHILFLTDRILMHLEHEVPPETEVIRELKEVMEKIRQETWVT